MAINAVKYVAHQTVNSELALLCLVIGLLFGVFDRDVNQVSVLRLVSGL